MNSILNNAIYIGLIILAIFILIKYSKSSNEQIIQKIQEPKINSNVDSGVIIEGYVTSMDIGSFTPTTSLTNWSNTGSFIPASTTFGSFAPTISSTDWGNTGGYLSSTGSTSWGY